MKKRILLVLSLLLSVIFVLSIVGCSSKETVKTEDELKDEIKAEMEAEAKLKEELKAEVKAEMEAEKEKDKEETEKVEEEEAEVVEEVEEVEEIVATYAYFDNDEADVSGLEKIELNCIQLVKDNTPSKELRLRGEDVFHKIAIFGEVSNVSVDFLTYYEDQGIINLVRYDTLKDTEITIITGSEYGYGQDILVSFEDGRGLTQEFYIYNNGVGEDKLELVSDITKEEKKPTSYLDFDLSVYTKYISMNLEDFKKSDIFSKIEYEIREDGMEYYILKDEIKGLTIQFSRQSTWDMDTDVIVETVISGITIYKNDKYEHLSESEKYSYYGMDFDMTEFGARYNYNTSSDFNVSVWGYPDENYILDSISISKKVDENANTEVEKNYTIHKIEDLKNGDEVGGMTVENLEYISGSDRVAFDLTGFAVVLGQIKFDEMYGYVVVVEGTYTFDEAIKISYPSGFTYEFDLDYMMIANPEVLTEEQKTMIQKGEYVGGKISIESVTHRSKDESEAGTACVINSIY